ncbi:hypothetical protein QTP70_010414 [Hemibagrus guttatus]|uniref:ribonuclease H n=1 Tax=Hemibagrus guttatus TaxID=175788 RepID=A0AAE0QH30_9TELE|nr:hypothetical protein QTP70_010414 [Hemibagrus guttatus]
MEMQRMAEKYAIVYSRSCDLLDSHRTTSKIPTSLAKDQYLVLSFSPTILTLLAVISSHGFSYHCYADDTQLIFSFLTTDTTASARILACLVDISSWMTAHQLKLNPSKTKLLVIPAAYSQVVQPRAPEQLIVMDQLSEEVRQESPWTMMFADDIVICSESREQMEENLERWRFALERRGMKVSRSKTEYMCVNEREGSGTVRLQGEEVKKVQEFKYLGSTVQSNGECGKEVKKRVQAVWNGWRKVSGVLCDQKISARIKGKVYRTVVRPAMLYGLETVSLRKRQESELEVAELKMLRFSLGVTRLDRIRNEYIRGTAHVGRLGDKVMESRLRWFGHVQRRETHDPEEVICNHTQALRN